MIGIHKPLRVCQVVASINQHAGGPSITVPRLAESLANQGVSCTLVSLDYDNLGPQVDCRNVEPVSIPAPWLTERMRGWNRDMRCRLLHQGRNVDVIHNHGLWMFPNVYARQAAINAKIPLVISPRGMLEEWSLGRSRAKKCVAWHLFEWRNLRAAQLLHATSVTEAEALRRIGLRQPITIIPNGVDIPEPTPVPSRSLLEKKYPELNRKRWLLFLSRIHPKKGVTELLTAWSKQATTFPDWHLIVAGPDLNGHGNVVRDQAKRSGLNGRVTFTGMVAGAEKDAVLANSEIFVLPTHSENFGVAIAEALAFGLPVITTRGAPWRDLETYRCGWWIDVDPSALTTTLAKAMRTPTGALREMGRRGRELMLQKYSWERVGEQMKASYEWLLRRADRPEFVQLS